MAEPYDHQAERAARGRSRADDWDWPVFEGALALEWEEPGDEAASAGR